MVAYNTDRALLCVLVVLHGQLFTQEAPGNDEAMKQRGATLSPAAAGRSTLTNDSVH